MSEISYEDALAHFGVKGMKWGVRKDPKTGVRPIAKALDSSKFGALSKANVERHNHRKAMRTLNKASKARDNAARVAAIEGARARVSSGQSRKALKEAKAQYKIDKNVIGSREAKKALTKARETYYTDKEVAKLAKDNQELAQQLIIRYAAYRITGVLV